MGVNQVLAFSSLEADSRETCDKTQKGGKREILGRTLNSCNYYGLFQTRPKCRQETVNSASKGFIFK